MKEYKKLLQDLVLFIFNLIGFLVTYSTLFLGKTINLETYIILSFLTAWFYTKSVIDKQDLENKIFELKQLLENDTNKTI
jgi:hypothetical protein